MNNCEKCGYYSDGECNICGMGMSGEDTFCRLCKDNPNCYYKQLSELKESLKCFQKPEVVKVLTDYRTGEIDNLRQENERLKEKNEKLNKMTGIFSVRLCKKYEQTLQEIKAIAKGVRGYLEVPSPRDVRFEMDRILDLITKAEEE